MVGANALSPDRFRCEVPFCRRTVKRTMGVNQESVCCVHWPLVPKRMKRAYSRIRRRFEKHPSEALNVAQYRIWRRCVRAAREAAAGI